MEAARAEPSPAPRPRVSPRISWWVTFALLTTLGGAWALASPPTGAPDERDHAINANAVARGQLVGDPPTPAQARRLAPGRGQLSAYRSVDVPEVYDRPNTACFAFLPQASAACFHFDGPDRVVPVLTPVTWYPPAYYAVVGLVARPFEAGAPALYVMRLVGVLIMAGLLASAVASLRRLPASRVRIVAFLTGLTPMALFFGASVNPSGPEIIAGLALWASGAVLVREALASGVVDSRVALRVGIAATVLALSRQDAPLWLALIVLTLALVAGMAGLRTLWGSRAVRVWAVIVAVCTAAQVAWVFGVGTLAAEHSVFRPDEVSGSEALRESIGRSFLWYRELVGWFGWLDTPPPALTLILWTLVLGGLVVLALTFGQRRWTVAALGVLGATFALPIVLEFVQSQGVGAGHWQGRYALPFAAGVPLLAAIALERDGTHARVSASLFPIAVALALGIAQVAAFGQNLRRYTVGYDGRVWFFVDPAWSPPVAPGLLMAGFVVALGATYWWMLRGTAATDEPVDTRRAPVAPTAVAPA